MRGASRTIVAYAGCLAAACASVRTPSYVALAERAEPALEDIFSIPGIHGEAPEIDSLSADGQWLLARWRGVRRGADGQRAWSDDLAPFLLPRGSAAVALDEANSLPRALERLEREAHANGGQRVVATLENWQPDDVGRLAWSEHGRRLAIEWEHALVLLELDDGAITGRDVLYVDGPEKRSEPEPATGEVTPDDDGADDAARTNAPPRRLGKLRGLEFDGDDELLVARTSDEIFVFPLASGRAWPLSLADADWPTRALDASLDDLQWSRTRDVFFSPTKKLGEVEIVRDDGALAKLEARAVHLSGEQRPVALDGMLEIKSLETARLSPDGQRVFGCEVDHSREPAPTLIPNFLTERVSTLDGRRQLADDTWLPRKLWMWNTADGSRGALELPGDDAYSFAFLGWAPQDEPGAPARCAFRRVASDYRTAEVWLWSEGALECVILERDERWVGGPGSGTRWSRDGRRLIFASECLESSTTPGRSQIFVYDVATQETRQLTAVEGEVASFTQNDLGEIVFSASRDNPAQRVVGVLSPRKPEDAAQDAPPYHPVRYLDVPSGWCDSIVAAGAGGSVALLHQRLGQPAELWHVPLSRDDGDARQLTSSTSPDYAAHAWIRPVELSATHADGTTVRSHVFLPRGSSLTRPDRARPCVVFIHGAGYLQNVTDSMTEYAVNLMFHSRLASMGYVVADVDYRGSAGYGNRFRTDVQNDLGRLELEDIASIIDELARRGVIDPERVGCYGGSYGGFLTLMALFTQSERWACGAALRSVTDWRTYHPGYTQPRLGRPSSNADAYKRSSPIDHAEKLRDPLLILHGMVDSNVFAQDSIRLIEKLIDLGLDFDAMLYPSQGHAFDDGAHWLDEYKRIERFMVQHLGVP